AFDLLATPNKIMRALSPSERLVIYILSTALALGAFLLLVSVNSAVSVRVPSYGGSITEGVVGPARFINPIIAVSQADGDLAALVYSGLMRAMPDGSLIPDLASHYEISEDGTVYTFTLRGDATFHDGTAVTAGDV